MEIRHAIFDFDGTLFDSMYVWQEVGIRYLEDMGKVARPDLDDAIRILSLPQAAEYFIKEYGVESGIDDIVNTINSNIEHAYFHEVMPKVGAVSFLERLREQGVDMCIATATDRYLIEGALARCGLSSYFKRILTCSETGHSKDEPHIFREAMEFLGGDRSDTLVFEDSLQALKTASDDGFLTAGVKDSSECHQEEIRKICDIYIESFEKVSERSFT